MIEARITRRAFIGLGAAILGFGLAVGGWRWQADSEAGSALGAPGLAAFFSDPEAARRIGRAYLDGPAPGESPDELAARAFPDRTRSWLGDASRRQLVDELGVQTRTDLEEGRIVRVAGWQLAESEAAICALYEVAVA